MSATEIDILSLNDDEVRSLLIETGIHPGPIVDSTRGFYQSLLAKKLQRQGGQHESSFEDEVSDDEEEEEEEEEPVITPHIEDVTKEINSRPKSQGRSFGTDETDMRQRVRRPQFSPTSRIDDVTTPVQKGTEKQSDGAGPSIFSWFFLVVLVIICIFIALVYFYIEPNKNPYEEIEGV